MIQNSGKIILIQNSGKIIIIYDTKLRENNNKKLRENNIVNNYDTKFRENNIVTKLRENNRKCATKLCIMRLLCYNTKRKYGAIADYNKSIEQIVAYICRCYNEIVG